MLGMCGTRVLAGMIWSSAMVVFIGPMLRSRASVPQDNNEEIVLETLES